MGNMFDCSHHQGVINWARVKADGYEAVAIKITEGVSYTDPNWLDYYAGAGSVGLLRGAYHFADLNNAAAEADHFTTALMIHNWELIPTGDIELAASTATWTKAFIARVRQRTGKAWMRVYTSYALLTHAMNPSGWCDPWTSIWAARYNPSLGWDHAGLELWQNTDAATIDGIVGHVDAERYQHGWTPKADGARTGVLHTVPGHVPVAHPVTGKLPANTVLKPGYHGAAVSTLQRTLNAGYPAYSHLRVDGDYGPATTAVVREFQQRSRLAVDGIAGPATLRALHLA